MESIKVLNLDFRGLSNIMQTLKAVQYDDGRAVRVLLSGTEGTISKARVYCQKPSGKETYTEGTVVNDYCVLFELTPQMLAETGIVKAQLQLMDGEHVVTSFDFQIQVSKNRIASSSITSSDEYQALVEALKDVDRTETEIEKNRSDISEVKNRMTDAERNINVHTSQIAEMQKIPEGGTTADAALNDIKIGYDGTEYESPGEAVRGQFGKTIMQQGVLESGRLGDIVTNGNWMLTDANEYTDCPIDNAGRSVDTGWLIVDDVPNSNIVRQVVISYWDASRFIRIKKVPDGIWTDWFSQYRENPTSYKIRKLNILDNLMETEEEGYYNKGVWIPAAGWKSAMIPIEDDNPYMIWSANNIVDYYMDDKYVASAIMKQIRYEVIPGSAWTSYLFEKPHGIRANKVYVCAKDPEHAFIVSTPFPTQTYLFLQEDKEDEIVVCGGRIVNKQETTLIEKEDVYNGIISFSGNKVESVSYVTTGLMYFKKGTIVDTKNTGVQFDIRGMTANKVLYVTREEANCHYEFTEDAYASIHGLVGDPKWVTDKPDIDVLDYRAFIRIITADERAKNPWKGKIWWAYGTSITDIGADDAVGNNGHSGKYPLCLEAYSELQRNNGAIGSGGILDDKADDRNYRLNILKTPYDTDLVTIETLPNDDYTNKLGEIGDAEPSTICGALTQCFEYLTNNTRARIVLLIVTGSIHAIGSETSEENYKPYEATRTNWRKAVEKITELANLYGVTVIDADANALDWGRRKTGLTYRDHIHINYLGGEIFGRYIWDELKKIRPYPSYPTRDLTK